MGIIIAHASVLLLLVGGVVTALSREEGYIALGKGQVSDKVSDYHERELAVLKNGTVIAAIPNNRLHAGAKLAGLPFPAQVEKYCENCRVVDSKNPDAYAKGLAAKFDIMGIPSDQEDAKNQAGVVFHVPGPSEAQGTYLVAQALNQNPDMRAGQDTYQFILRQSERTIPFSLRLLQFEKTEYPGTDIARSYRSEVEVSDGVLKWNKLIEMNEPLRYRGYTIYQSSFVENNGELMSVLAVVKNSGDLFPYIAITALCMGLVIHIIMRALRKKAA